MLIQVKPKYRKIEPLWLSPFVCSGLRPYSPRQLFEKKIKTSISLQSGWYEVFTRSEYESAEYDARLAYGVDMIQVPLSDIWKPDISALKSIFRLILTVEGPVYFHCLHGKDRTGYVRALYRILVNGWSCEAARLECLNQGFHSFPYFFWLRSLSRDADELRSSLGDLIKAHQDKITGDE